jgi:hypothetical protein
MSRRDNKRNDFGRVPDERPMHNRYGSVEKLPVQEMKLSTTHNNFVVSKGALWNGGDGMDYRLVETKIRNRFNEKGFSGLIDGTETMPAPIEAELAWSTARMDGVAGVHLEIRNLNYQALRRQHGLDETIGWDAPVQIQQLDDMRRREFQNSKFQIEMAYNRGLTETRIQTLNLKKDYKEAVARRAKERKDFEEKRTDCAALFRELLGPAALVHIEGMITNHQFDQAMTRLATVYATVPDATFRTTLIKKLAIQVFSGQETLSGWMQHLEEMWAPLTIEPQVYSDGEKVDGILNGGSIFAGKLETALDYARSGNFTYEATKAHLLRTMNWIINDEGKKINGGLTSITGQLAAAQEMPPRRC